MEAVLSAMVLNFLWSRKAFVYTLAVFTRFLNYFETKKDKVWFKAFGFVIDQSYVFFQKHTTHSPFKR